MSVREEEMDENGGKSKLVDSLFSSFVAESIISAQKEKEAKKLKQEADDKDKKAKKKKKHKSPDKSKSEKRKKSSRHGSPEHKHRKKAKDEPGFFAKEKFIDIPEDTEKRHDDDYSVRESSESSKAKKKKKHKEKKDRDERTDQNYSSRTMSKSLAREAEKIKPTTSKHYSSSDSDEYYSEQLEKAYESRLQSLKKNLVKRHKEMKDIQETYSIPEKKIRLYTDIVLEEKRKEEELEEAMQAAAIEKEKKEGGVNPISKALWQPSMKKAESDGEESNMPRPKVLKKSSSDVGDDQEKKEETENAQDSKIKSFTNQIIIGKKGKIGLRFGLKISELSAHLISAGGTADAKSEGVCMEDGEISDSGKSKASKEESDDENDERKVIKEPTPSASEGEIDDLGDSDGALPDSDTDTKAEKKKKKEKKKHKKDKKSSKDSSERKKRSSLDDPDQRKSSHARPKSRDRSRDESRHHRHRSTDR